MKKRLFSVSMALILAVAALLPVQAQAAQVPKTVLAYTYGVDRSDTVVTQYAYDTKGNLLWEQERNVRRDTVDTYVYQYSADGVLEQETKTAEGHALSSRNDTFVTRYNEHGDEVRDGVTYEYDDQGRKVKETASYQEITYTYHADGSYVSETMGKDETGAVVSRYKETYNSEGKPLSIIREDLQEKFVCEYTHEYDEHGNKVAKHYTEKRDGKETLTVDYTYNNVYDAKGKLILTLHSCESSDPEDESSQVYTSYDYDEKGRCVRTTYVYDDHYSFEAWEYDADGNQIAYIFGTDKKVKVTELHYVYLPLKEALYEK